MRLDYLITKLNSKFKQFYNPTQHLSIDEAMIAFTGRLGWIQYSPDKPTKWGVKSFQLCDANNYLYHFSYYTGKPEEVAANSENLHGKAYDVVLSTVDCLPKGHPWKIAMDNWYTSTKLAVELLNKGIYMVGTMRKDRKGFPAESMTKKLDKKGEYEWRTLPPQLLAVRYKDTKTFFMISTFHRPDQIDLASGLPQFLSGTLWA